jgi:hypothetical protein
MVIEKSANLFKVFVLIKDFLVFDIFLRSCHHRPCGEGKPAAAAGCGKQKHVYFIGMVLLV